MPRTSLATGRSAPWEVETKRRKNRKPPSTQEIHKHHSVITPLRSTLGN